MADYKITQTDYNILKNALVVLSSKVSGLSHACALANAKNVMERIQPIPKIVNGKEVLTDDKMRELFGMNYDGILYYNFDAKKWNTGKYMGIPVKGQDIDTANAIEMQIKMHRMKEFADFELVAVVTMLVPSNLFSTCDNIVENPQYDMSGNAVLGTIVKRGKVSGRILPMVNRWVPVRRYIDHDTACADGSYRFVFEGATNPLYSKLLVEKLCQHK